jgi:ribosome biogenesis protein MAK21
MGSKRTKDRKKGADKPSFDEAALAQLTSKLDKSLGDSEKQRPPKRKRQRDDDDEHEPKRHQHRPSDRGPQGEIGGGVRKSKQAPSLLDEILALGGNEEDLELVANVDSGDEGGDAPRPKVSSESIVDKSLRDELAQFASSLGLNNFRDHEDPETDEDADEAEEDSELVQDFESMEDSEAADEGGAAAPPPPEGRQEKTAGKLVSEQPCIVPLATGINRNV